MLLNMGMHTLVRILSRISAQLCLNMLKRKKRPLNNMELSQSQVKLKLLRNIVIQCQSL